MSLTTNDLAGGLALDVRPAPRVRPSARLGVGLLAGALAPVALLMHDGVRPDVAAAASTLGFWLKALYPLAIMIFAVGGADQAARPVGLRAWPFIGLAVTAGVILAGAAASETGPAAARAEALFGRTALSCPLSILIYAAGPLVGLFSVVRSLAPTRLRVAGAVTGLAAGATGAFFYSLHCTETGLPFLAAWYSLGMIAAAGVGAIVGGRLLRW